MSRNLMESTVYHPKQLLWFIVLHLCVDVHRCLTVFMSGKVLDCLGINASIQKVGNIGMPKLMWRHIEVDGIYQFWIVLLMAAEGWGNSALNALTVDIPIDLDEIVQGAVSADPTREPAPLAVGNPQAVMGLGAVDIARHMDKFLRFTGLQIGEQVHLPRSFNRFRVVVRHKNSPLSIAVDLPSTWDS